MQRKQSLTRYELDLPVTNSLRFSIDPKHSNLPMRLPMVSRNGAAPFRSKTQQVRRVLRLKGAQVASMANLFPVRESFLLATHPNKMMNGLN